MDFHLASVFGIHVAVAVRIWANDVDQVQVGMDAACKVMGKFGEHKESCLPGSLTYRASHIKC